MLHVLGVLLKGKRIWAVKAPTLLILSLLLLSGSLSVLSAPALASARSRPDSSTGNLLPSIFSMLSESVISNQSQVTPASCGAPTISLDTPSVSGLTVSVNGVTLPGGPGCSISYISWTWGDGTSSNSWFPATHTYTSDGAFTIMVTTHQSDGQTASASTSVDIFVGGSPSCSFPPGVVYSSGNFPISEGYQDYGPVSGESVFTPSAQSGPSAISVGVMGGIADVQVTQGGRTILSSPIGGPLRYVAVTASVSYCYANFKSNGQNLQVNVSTESGSPLVAYNVYDNYISNFTASLITYPPQFAVNMNPSATPTNTGLSFLLVAPKYTHPTPLAIWVGEGFSNPATGSEWWAQIGFNNWAGDMNVSFAGWGIFSNIFGNPGGTDYSYPLVPGDTYNFTMALVSGTTWEFTVNGTLIPEGSLTGLFNTTTSVANEGTALGLETLTAWGGNVNITNSIKIPVMTSFRVNNRWSEPSSFSFGSIGENWWNNVATSAPGIALWGIAGHLQDSSVPNGSLLFDDSLPMILDVPTTSYEPLYGGFSLTQMPSGGGIVDVSQISSTSIAVSPVNGPAYVTVASYLKGSASPASLSDALVTAPRQFDLPQGSGLAVVYAANVTFSSTSVSVVQMNNSQGTNTLSLSPSLGAAGTYVAITGADFLASHALMVMYDDSTAEMPTTCSTDSSGNINSGCTLQVPPSALGPHKITVSDGTNSPTATFTVTLLGVTCSKSSVVVGSATTCKATVHESGTKAPTGKVTWSSNGSGKFSATSCKLSRHNTYSTCSVRYTPTATGSVIFTASYAGDSNNRATAGAYKLIVAMKVTTTTVFCAPTTIKAGSGRLIKCSVQVFGYHPTGTVTFTQSSSNGGL